MLHFFVCLQIIESIINTQLIAYIVSPRPQWAYYIVYSFL